MPTTIAAMRAVFGDNEYYLTTMAVGEFVRNVRFPRDLPGWAEMSMEEKYQREVNVNRVRRDIAPYFANNGDRFTGAIVVGVINDEQMKFEPLDDFGGGRSNPVPQLYRTAAINMGFLTLQGSEVLVPLDGQHRAKAFKYAVDGQDDSGRPIAGIQANADLAKDQVPLILLRFDQQRARVIFNKLNRYAKATTRATNLVIDDDDAIAVMTRELVGKGGVMDTRLVRIGVNTLSANSPEFTTLPTMYDCNKALVTGLGFQGHGKPESMEPAQRELVRKDLKGVWELLLSQIDLWAKAIADPSENGDQTRIAIRNDAVVGRPIAQLAAVLGFLVMRQRCAGVPEVDLCARFNQIDWNPRSDLWRNILVTPDGRMLAGRRYAVLASKLMAHLCGAQLSAEEQRGLLEQMHGLEWEEHQLPEPVA